MFRAAYYAGGGALAGWGLGYAIIPSAPVFQFFLAAISAWGIASVNLAMDREKTQPCIPHAKCVLNRLRSNASVFSGGTLTEAGALRVAFFGLALLAVFWLARDATETLAYNWFGSELNNFVEDRWPLVLSALVALLGFYRYISLRGARGRP